MSRQRAGGGDPGNANPEIGDMFRDAAAAMRKAEAALAQIGDALTDASGQADRAIREAMEAQQRAIREASRAQEQALAAAEEAISRAMTAAPDVKRKKR
ncbi:MAG TPA: hypothetical protein VGW40_07525 [Allosphingosinicella sp.]|nr:hypothetical protein [Allosphingosinicella sp.]